MYISFVFVSIIFLLDCWTVLTVWYFLFFYWIAELFWQCGIFCFSIGLQNCSDSVVFFVFLLDYWTVLTVWYFFVFLLDCRTVLDSVVFFVFLLDYRTVLTVWYFFVFLLDCWTVLTVFFCLFFYWIAELFWQWYFFQLFILFTTIVVSLNPTHGEVYWTQHYLIKFVKWLATGLWLSPGTPFPPPVKITATI
jgi:hypothetical protein